MFMAGWEIETTLSVKERAGQAGYLPPAFLAV
jgi:hypothetical protein